MKFQLFKCVSQFDVIQEFSKILGKHCINYRFLSELLAQTYGPHLLLPVL